MLKLGFWGCGWRSGTGDPCLGVDAAETVVDDEWCVRSMIRGSRDDLFGFTEPFPLFGSTKEVNFMLRHLQSNSHPMRRQMSKDSVDCLPSIRILIVGGARRRDTSSRSLATNHQRALRFVNRLLLVSAVRMMLRRSRNCRRRHWRSNSPLKRAAFPLRGVAVLSTGSVGDSSGAI